MSQVSVEEARLLVAKHEVEVIDLRDEDGWVDGHIPGARRAGDDVEATLEEIDSERKLLVVCADGKRSAEVADELDGDREAVSLEGGMDAWQSDGMPSQPAQDYEPGPAPIDEGDDEVAAEITDGGLEPGEDPKTGDEDDDGSLDEPEPKAEGAGAQAEDAAGEPVENASGEESPQQERSS